VADLGNSRRGLTRGAIIAGLLGAAALLAAPVTAAAAPILVTANGDTAGSAGCVLRDAITSANSGAAPAGSSCAPGANPGADVITFDAAITKIDLDNPLPPITGDLQINGLGSSLLEVHAKNTCPSSCTIFAVSSGTVTLSGMEVTNGKQAGGGGAVTSVAGTTVYLDALHVHNINDESPAGLSICSGAVHNNGTMFLTRSTLNDNHVTSFSTGTSGSISGGAVCNDSGATMTIDESAINGNSVTASAATSFNGALGGGVANRGSMSIEHSTINGNSATVTNGAAGPSALGGGVANLIAGSHLTLTSDTIAANSISLNGTDDYAGGPNLGASDGTVDVRNTILAGPNPADATPQADNCDTVTGGAINSGGFNLETGTTCGFSILLHDLPSTLPLLQMLGPNGGPTATRALDPTSPAIEAGSSLGETTDQRGSLRPADFAGVATLAGSDGSDIGAYEADGVPFPSPPPPPVITPVPAPVATSSKVDCSKKKTRKKRRRCRRKQNQ
jgi:hypothetical protein